MSFMYTVTKSLCLIPISVPIGFVLLFVYIIREVSFHKSFASYIETEFSEMAQQPISSHSNTITCHAVHKSILQ